MYLNSKCLNKVIILDGDMYGVNPILDANVCGILAVPVRRGLPNAGEKMQALLALEEFERVAEM